MSLNRKFLVWILFGLFISSGQLFANDSDVNQVEETDEAEMAENLTQKIGAEDLPLDSQIQKAADTSEKKKKTDQVLESRKEDEIPVLEEKKSEAKVGGQSSARLLMSFGVILAAALALLLVGRTWAKRKSGLKKHHQIKILTQFNLGPKKQLAIIRVAGESLLIGITDHNINMIKSLALMDEDIPMEAPQYFDEELNSAERREEHEDEDFSFGGVKDVVASRIRELRNR